MYIVVDTIPMSGICLRLPVLILMALLSLNMRAAELYKTIEFNFSERDFVFSVNEDGEVVIDSKMAFVYPESDEPCLPLISKDIAVDGIYSYKSVNVSYEKYELMSDVRIAHSPIPIATDMTVDNNVEMKGSYDYSRRFPSSNCQYVSTSDWENLKVLHFLTTPFIYDAEEQKVYFIDSIRLEIELEENLSELRRPLNKIDASILKSFVANTEVVDELMSASSIDTHSLDIDGRIDYVVITNRELASAFKPLCQWKTEKGIFAKVITIEDIETNYEGKDTQLKIKNCLYDLCENHGLQYAMLGGDDYIVPVRGCYGLVKTSNSSTKDNSIPADIYYSCFDGCFDWDSNNNGIYGEIDDNINFKQSLFLTRLPIRQSSHVKAFINKLLKYEKDPIFNNNFLMCGSRMWEDDDTMHSDAEKQGSAFYQFYIQPSWKGRMYRFYDTATDFAGGREYTLNSQNLKTQLEEGYSFMQMITHGSVDSWEIEEGNGYNRNDGIRQNNKAQTIITTSSCHTNGFDRCKSPIYDPCLSESLIRNLNSGIVAYLGCSREGWGYRGSDIGPSLKYEAVFYKKLFSKSFETKNFGALVKAAKAAHISSSSNEYNAYRWLQFGLNPIGDPEMPIWISEPKEFGKTQITIGDSSVCINAQEESDRICVVDEINHGEDYFRVFEEDSKISLSDIPEASSICITKAGYIPKQIKMQILQNMEIVNNNDIYKDVILCGSSITSNLNKGPFVIKEGKTTLVADMVILGPGTKIDKGAELVVKNK